jgi:hypothetical protein
VLYTPSTSVNAFHLTPAPCLFLKAFSLNDLRKTLGAGVAFGIAFAFLLPTLAITDRNRSRFSPKAPGRVLAAAANTRPAHYLLEVPPSIVNLTGIGRVTQMFGGTPKNGRLRAN